MNCSRCPFFISDRSKNRSQLSFCHELPERIAHDRSFVKSSRNKSLKSLFKKERRGKELQEQFALGHKNGKHCQKHKKNFRAHRSIFASDSLETQANHLHCSFLKSKWLFKMNDSKLKSKERKSERANFQPCCKVNKA